MEPMQLTEAEVDLLIAALRAREGSLDYHYRFKGDPKMLDMRRDALALIDKLTKFKEGPYLCVLL